MSNTGFDKRVNGVIAAALLCATVAACGTDSVVTPPATPALSAVAVSPTSVAGGTGSTGTVTLTLAPTAGLPVALSSNNGSATVPSTVTVNSGVTSATFPVSTSAVGADTSVTITGTLNGTARTATLQLTAAPVVQPPPQPPAATPFTAALRVVSLSAAKRKQQNGTITDIPGKPAGTLDTCPVVVDGGNQRLDCEFDATASTSPTGIAKYRYKWRVTNDDGDSGEVTGSKFRPPAQPCGLFGGFTNDGSNNDPFVQMRVVLEITNPAGAVASVTLNNISVFPAGQCGAAF